MMERFGIFGARAALLVAAMLLAMATEAPAQGRGPVACGTFYTVVRGDTLHQIASRAYPRPDFMAIYEANRSFMPSPAQIEIGDQLFIPCLDGTGPRTRDEALAALAPAGATDVGGAAGAEAPAASAAPDGSPIARILVLSEAAPYAGKRLPEGGMVTELVSRAMLRAPSPVEYEVVFDESAAAAVEALGAGAYDLGFPVARPDCARAASLTEAQRPLCDAFVFSAPVADVETRFYVRVGDAAASAPGAAALAGRRLCRATGRFAGDAAGLAGAEVTRAPSTRDCFARLAEGAVDVVAASGPSLDPVEPRLRIEGAAVEVRELRRRGTIHVVAPKGNPRGLAFLATLDGGLAAIRQSGEWAEVVANHLALEPGAI